MNKRSVAVLLAASLAAGSAFSVYAAPSVIIGQSEDESESEAISEEAEQDTEVTEATEETEKTAGSFDETEAEDAPSADSGSDKPLSPKAEGITAEDAVKGARTLYSQMKHYAEETDNEHFSGCFSGDSDAGTIQNELQAILASSESTKDLDQHQDVCYFDPTKDSTQSPYYFGVGLTDYKVNGDGTVRWYSVLLRVAKYKDGWKASALPEDRLLTSLYPEGYEDALKDGRNAVDLYPYLALRFSEEGVFEGAFSSLVNMAWQNEDGSLSLALWLANGEEGTKWCDSIDLLIRDGDREVASVNAPVQQALESGESILRTVEIPADSVKTKKAKWTGLTVSSNLLYQ